MKVTLINYTQNAKDLLIFTKETRLKMSAVGLEDISKMSEEAKQDQLDYMVNTIKSSWEFMDFTFMIEDVSRAFTHQFVRNRLGSYAQQTMRILDMSDFSYVTGPSIKLNASIEQYYDETMKIINQRYHNLLCMGVAMEDARGVLPTNICTNIVAKFNLRTLSDMMASRASLRTQGEFRNVCDAMYDEVIAAEDWLAPFLRNGKHYALKQIENIILSDYEGTAMCNDYLKLIDQVRNAA